MFRRKIIPMVAAAWMLLFAVFGYITPAFAAASTITIDGMTASPTDVFGGGSYVWVNSSGELQNTSFAWLYQAVNQPLYLNIAFFDGSVASTTLPSAAGTISYPSGWTGATNEPLTNAGIAFVTVGGEGLTAEKQNGWFPLLPPSGTASGTYYNPFDNPAATGGTTSSTGTTTSSGTGTSGSGTTSSTSSAGGVSGGTGCNPQTVAPPTVQTSPPTGIVVSNIQYDSSTQTFTITGQNLPQLNGQETTPAGAGYNYLNFALYNPASGVLIGTYGDWDNTYGITVNVDTSTEIQFVDNSTGNLGSATWELYLAPSGSTINLYPPNSNYLTGAINIGTGQFIPPVTQAPTVNIESSSSTSVTLSWNAVASASSYQVFENGSSTASKTGIIGTSTTIGGLTPGQTYYFQVAGANSLLTGPESNIVELVPPLSPPSDLKAANFTQSSFDLTWDTEPNAAGYEVFENGVQIATTTTNSYTISGQAAGNYSFYVEAIDNCGDVTDPSNTVQITLNSPQSPVASVQASGTEGSSGSVTWTTSSSNPAGTTYQVSQNGQPVGTTTGTSMGVSNYDSGSTYAVSAITPPPTGVQEVFNTTSGTGNGSNSSTCTGTTVSWQPGTGTPSGTVYTVYENGTQIATTTSTSLTVPDCTVGATYTVTAQASGFLSSSALNGSGSGSSSGSGGTCDCTCPTPPDWNQITEQIGKEVWSQAPPIPPPPTGSATIPNSDQPAITTPSIQSGLGTFSVPSFSIPTTFSGEPSFSVPTSSANTNFTSGYSAIDVPTTDSVPFSIGDPNNLPHQAPGTVLIPGQAPSVGFTPSDPGLGGSDPIPVQSPPTVTSGPSYSGSADLLGSIPAWSDPSSGNQSGPTPSYSATSSTSNIPAPSTYTGATPDYSAGGTTGNLPIWSG